MPGRASTFVHRMAVALTLMAISQTIALLSIAALLFSHVDLDVRSLLPVFLPCQSYTRPSHYRECPYSVVADLSSASA
jgi:hypothetical protein